MEAENEYIKYCEEVNGPCWDCPMKKECKWSD